MFSTAIIGKFQKEQADSSLTLFKLKIFFRMVNIGALFSIPTTLMERYIGFWAAFLLPTLILIIATVPVLLWNSHLGEQVNSET